MCLDKKITYILKFKLGTAEKQHYKVCEPIFGLQSIFLNVADNVSNPHRLDATIKLMYIPLSPIYMATVISNANCQYYKGKSEIQFLNVNEILQSTTFGLWGLTNLYHIYYYAVSPM